MAKGSVAGRRGCAFSDMFNNRTRGLAVTVFSMTKGSVAGTGEQRSVMRHV